MQYNRHPQNYYVLDIKAVDLRSHKKVLNKEEQRQMLDLGFSNTLEKLKRIIFRHIQRNTNRSNEYY